MSFGICVDDNSNILEQFIVDSNENVVKLHDWQERAIDYFFKHNCKTIYEVSTGAGKTFLAISILKKIHEKEPNLKCLIVNPKNVILENWHKELYNAGYNLPDIGIYYGLGKEYAKVTITNMQSLNKVALELFDIIIFDEIHNYGSKALLKIMESVRTKKYLIGLSATLERRDSTHYDIMSFFEYNVFHYTPGQAIQEGVLNRFKFFNVSVEMDDETMEEYTEITQQLNLIMKTGGGFNQIMRSKGGMKYKMLSLMTKRKQLINNYHRKFDVAKEICKKYPDEKIIVFNQYNLQTSKLYWHLLEVGINSRIVHSNIKQDERERALIDFRQNKYNVLLTSKVLDEGWNLPSVSCAIIMAGDSTNKQTIQRLGRVLRRKDTESLLFQVYCKNTIEEDHANIRSKMFKELSSFYKDYEYKLNNELILND